MGLYIYDGDSMGSFCLKNLRRPLKSIARFLSSLSFEVLPGFVQTKFPYGVVSYKPSYFTKSTNLQLCTFAEN